MYKFINNKMVRKKLKETIKGQVWTKVYNDDLHIRIKTIECGSDYEYIVKDLSNKILYGLNLDEMACEITKNYRRYINDIFFR